VAEKGEVFDSTLLKNMINSLIAEGKRNFAIDLSPLDYIYSDAINVILALNRRILDVSGRLSIMGPIPEVRQILERTGLHNILKIFDTEAELLKSSEDIILQTTRYNVADLQSMQQAPPKPKSEFEDLRSEISTAMSSGVAPVETEPDRGYRQAPPQYAAPQEPPPQQYAKPAAFKEEDFEAAYKSFETEATQDSYGPPPQAMRPPAPPQYAEPFTPPPVSPPRQPAQPFRRPEQEFAPVQEPPPTARRRDADFAPSRPEPLQPPPPTRRVQQPEDFEMKSEAAAPKGKAKAAFEEKPGREYEGLSPEAEEMVPRKRSPMPIIITLLVVVLLAAGGYYGYTMYIKGQQKEAAPAPAVQPVAPAVSQPAPAPVKPPTPAVAAPAPAPAPAVEPAKPPPAVVEAPPEKPSKKTPPGKQGSKKPAPEPVAKKGSKTGPEEGPAMAPPASPAGKIIITSNPTGATIKADENVIGTTPFVWKNPNIVGEVTIVVSKAGFKESAKTIEFTGGSKTEFFKLEKEEAAPVAKPAPKSAEPAPEPEAAAPAPAPKPAPPPPAPAPEAPAPAASSGGGEPATIFISSLPPVADVYMDGKLIGKTNITKLNVLSGSHSMRFVKGTAETTQDKTFKAGDNPSWFVSIK
jgi:anti-anti-sigma factor